MMNHENTDDGEHWLSISDMMSGLMVIFLFIAITYMMQVKEEKQKIKKENDRVVEIATNYKKNKYDIHWYLKGQFKAEELEKWNAKIDKESLSISFYNPEILFDIGKADIKPQFKEILDDFFPRYIQIIGYFENIIEEVRIEGHTSSEWSTLVSEDESYFKNMALSQERTRATLEYCLSLPKINENKDKKEWLKSVLIANGLSSSKLIKNDDKTENKEKSRRVEFKIRTNAEQELLKILPDK